MVVRPTAMRTTPSVAIRTTTQSDVQLPQMSVQPIISSVVPTSVTSSAVTPITTSMVQETRDVVSDELPRALVQPRQSSEEPQPIAGPSVIAPGNFSSFLFNCYGTYFVPLLFCSTVIFFQLVFCQTSIFRHRKFCEQPTNSNNQFNNKVPQWWLTEKSKFVVYSNFFNWFDV
jgi:hypothetical protein